MKYLILVVCSIILTSSLSAYADNGPYACASIDPVFPDGSINYAKGVETALNSLNCDTTKPVTSLTISDSEPVVCCVQK